MTAPLPKVCLIGAGASGITTCKALADRGIPFDCFDKGHRVGGIWVLDSESGLSSAYRELQINVSRERMEYTDYPMPKSLPPFPHHTQIVEYFEDYVRHFRLGPHIHLRTGVESAVRRQDGLWDVTLDTGETRTYDALVVANGHHSEPRWPDPPYPGRFDGIQMHSHDYRGKESLRDRDVLVVGLGNSAIDVAVESSYVSTSTTMSVRRGAHIIPKYVMGRPMDQVPGSRSLEYLLGRGIGRRPFTFQIPFGLRSWIIESGLRLLRGTMEDYGLPKPDHGHLAAHPAISTRFLDRLAHGRIDVRPTIDHFEGDEVVFTDGSRTRADVIVFCTGYKVTFPFLSEDVMSVEDNMVETYQYMFRPGIENLVFIGLCQPMAGSTMQVSELQARWAAAYLAGDCALPSQREMAAWIDKRRRRASKRYVRSPRHTMQIEQFEFDWESAGEMRRGRRRVRRKGAGPAVTARAAALDAASAPGGVATRDDRQRLEV